MAGDMEEFSIRSLHGPLRDLVPIYSVNQLLLNLVGLGMVLWLHSWLAGLLVVAIILVMLGWAVQFASRPCVMMVSEEQATWLEAVLAHEGFYGKSELDDRWRLIEAQWWQRWPHEFIEFVRGDQVMLIAPCNVMDSLRDCLEFVEDRGQVLRGAGDWPSAFETLEPEVEQQLPWHMHVPTALLGVPIVAAWIWSLFATGSEGMSGWGVSAMALSQGRFETIFLHMFAHGGPMHLMMNLTALVGIGATLTSRLGRAPLNWLRFVSLFALGGLAGAALFLALHPAGTVPMVGASGGLYALVGLLIRTPPNGGALLSVRSMRIRRIGWDLVKENMFLFALLAVIAWTSGTAGGLAWEAHLAGFLFGMFVGPKLLPAAAAPEAFRAPEPRVSASFD